MDRALAIKGEEAIVWEEDISRLDYVREMFVSVGSRRRPIPWYHYEGRRVGYAVLRPDARNLRPDARNDGRPGTFTRRVFFLKPYDRDSDPDGIYSVGAPFEAVDPRTVHPGHEGELTSRAWGCPVLREAS